MGPDHSPLSKRPGTTSVAEFRAKGYLPESLVNYLALIGWSPRGSAHGRSADDNAELLPIDELARRFSLESVGHSAGVFDEEKLAWVNRHYLKMADPIRIAELAVAYFNDAGVQMAPSSRGLEFLASAMPIATGSVDRLDQVPARLAFLFDYDAEAALRDGVRRSAALMWQRCTQRIVVKNADLRREPRSRSAAIRTGLRDSRRRSRRQAARDGA